MKALIKVGLLTLAGIISQSVLAVGMETEGNTTCSILQDSKLIKKSPCSYKLSTFASLGYGGTDYSFKIKNYGRIDTSVAIKAKTNSKGGFVENADGIVFNSPVITLNKKPAFSLHRDMNTLRTISDNAFFKSDDIVRRNGLSCMQQTKTKLEICIPAKDGYLGGN